MCIRDRNKVVALDGVSLHIKKGEVYGVIGLSGAGKSTLIRAINNLEKVDSGNVYFEGVAINQLNGKALSERRKKIGMIFQHFHLMSSRTVEGNIAFPLEIAGWSKVEIENRITELLELVGLPDKRKNYPNHLSGGQKQRVAIARALANNPKVLLCDEATSALDPITTRSILDLLKSINSQIGLTIVLITHEMDVIESICDKVAVMENGKVIEHGNVNAVLSNPKCSTTRAFLLSEGKGKKLHDAS